MAPENFEAISRSAKLPSNLEVIRTNILLISKTKTTLAMTKTSKKTVTKTTLK